MRSAVDKSIGKGEPLLRAWSIVKPAIAPLVSRVNYAGKHGYHLARVSAVPVTGYCVYRAKNAGHVREFMNQLPPSSTFHLHALDHESPHLRAWTRGSGPGMRMPLLQGLIDRHPPASDDDYVMIFDDDVTFAGSGGARFPGLAAAAQLDIAQPAHHPDSHASYRITKWEPLSTVRLTTFVEGGI